MGAYPTIISSQNAEGLRQFNSGEKGRPESGARMTKLESESQTAKLSADTIAEDLFGLNIRGLRSIATLWRHPKRYFAAARVPDWQNKYTPSIRLWLSFFAIFSALKFWWIGDNQGMIDAFSSGFANAQLQLPSGITYDDLGREAVLWIFGLTPLTQIVSMIILALFYRGWGEKTTIALRQRYLFAVLVPSASLMPLFLTIMVFVPSNWLTPYAILLAILTFAVDFQAGYRGGFSKVVGFSKIWRAALLALIVVGINVSTNIITQIVGIILIASKYGGVALG